jgi:CLIP-associating protein 1/2
MSLLTKVSDPLLFMQTFCGALDRFIEAHPDNPTEGDADKSILAGDAARASGYVFGLTGMAMCILRLPKEVVIAEGTRLERVVMAVSMMRV